jgi:hypothetical protein
MKVISSILLAIIAPVLLSSPVAEAQGKSYVGIPIDKQLTDAAVGTRRITSFFNPQPVLQIAPPPVQQDANEFDVNDSDVDDEIVEDEVSSFVV